jgi:biotin-(acetyl-CoA carboxylase) ligase
MAQRRADFRPKGAGVLIDSELSGSEVRYALVGIGINVNFDIPEDSEIAAIGTSLKRVRPSGLARRISSRRSSTNSRRSIWAQPRHD